jgi:hypothetical protein
MGTSRRRPVNERQKTTAPATPSEILERGKAIVESYQIVLYFENSLWRGRGVELPGGVGIGRTVERCMIEAREALLRLVVSMLEKGKRPPPPAASHVRSEQVNIRLTAEEKLQLETAAKQRGFSGLSDFIRAAAVEASAS